VGRDVHGRNVYGAKCPSMGRSVHGAKCPWGEKFINRLHINYERCSMGRDSDETAKTRQGRSVGRA